MLSCSLKITARLVHQKLILHTGLAVRDIPIVPNTSTLVINFYMKTKFHLKIRNLLNLVIKCTVGSLKVMPKS
jgi:hypothetical protein